MPSHPDRVLRLQGATNFRDLGGYPGRDGRPLRWRRVFRSDHLGALTAPDREALAALGLRRVLDFRGVQERGACPNVLEGVSEHSLAIEPTVVQRMDQMAQAGEQLTGKLVAGLMEDLYRGLVNDHAHRFAELFQHLLDADGPLVFHCTAGKDRTGLAAALLLLALGVPRSVVLQDYLLTNQHFRHPPMPATRTPPEALAVLWRVQENFLEAALQAVERDHGGLDNYLRRRLGLGDAELDALARRYLQPA